MSAPDMISAWPSEFKPQGVSLAGGPVNLCVRYIRADLATPPLSAALALPQIAALVDALRGAIDAIDAAYDGPDDNGAYSTRERAALSALDAAKGGAE